MPSSQRASYVPPANFPGGRYLSRFFSSLNDISAWLILIGLECALAYIAYCEICGWGWEESIHHTADMLTRLVN